MRRATAKMDLNGMTARSAHSPNLLVDCGNTAAADTKAMTHHGRRIISLWMISAEEVARSATISFSPRFTHVVTHSLKTQDQMSSMIVDLISQCYLCALCRSNCRSSLLLVFGHHRITHPDPIDPLTRRPHLRFWFRDRPTGLTTSNRESC